MRSVKFVNFSDELFAHPSLGGSDELCKWNNEPYSFPAKTSLNMEEWKADHFAKHLVNRELFKAKKYSDMSPSNPEQSMAYMELYNKAIIDIGTPQMSAEKVKDVIMNSPETEKTAEDKFCEFCDSKGGRHKKDCPTLAKSKDDEFEGL